MLLSHSFTITPKAQPPAVCAPGRTLEVMRVPSSASRFHVAPTRTPLIELSTIRHHRERASTSAGASQQTARTIGNVHSKDLTSPSATDRSGTRR